MLEKFAPMLSAYRARHTAGSIVARHRMVPWFSGRSRVLLAVAAAMTLAGFGGLVNTTTAPERDQAAASVAAEVPTDYGLAERETAASRADRSERTNPAERDPAAPGGVEPEESPEPEPEPEPTEEAEEAEAPEEEPEPEPTEEARTEEAAAGGGADFVHPMPGASTTSCYGMRWGALHAGVDLAAPAGTPIRTVAAGTVTDAGWVFGGYGISVVVDHGNGFYTHYAHMSETGVSAGQQVSPGQTIGLEGSTGDSTGPHLHFEVHQGLWNQIEPTGWTRERGVNIGGC